MALYEAAFPNPPTGGTFDSDAERQAAYDEDLRWAQKAINTPDISIERTFRHIPP